MVIMYLCPCPFQNLLSSLQGRSLVTPFWWASAVITRIRGAKRSCVSKSACIIVLFNLAVADLPLVVSEPAQLFWELKHADITSITQMMGLAKLALFTFQDEDDDSDIEHTATGLVERHRCQTYGRCVATCGYHHESRVHRYVSP